MLILKILHILALAVGLGGGIAGLIVGQIAGPKDPALAGAIQGRLGWLSFLAILVLWATGLVLLWNAGGWTGQNFWFWLKIVAVLILTGLAVRMRIAARTPGPDTARLGRRLGPIISAAAALAVVFAVAAFG